MAVLVIEKSADEKLLGQVHELLETPLPDTIGRDATNAISLQDFRASRVHGAVYLRFGEWVVEDRDSRNGILHHGEKIKRSPLTDGDVFVIGSTHFRFFEDRQTEAPEGKESFGCRIESRIDAGGGVLKYTAWQLAMDRRVRLDLLHPRCRKLRNGRPIAEVHRAVLTDAIEAASHIEFPGVAPVLSAAVPDAQGGVTVMSRMPGTRRLGADLEAVRSWSLHRRLALVEKLALAILARGRNARLRFPTGVTDIWLDPDGGEPTVLALEIHALLALSMGWVAHSPALVPYLAPEYLQRRNKNERAAPATLASLIYNIGALAYHILAGRSPSGCGEESLRRRLREPPTDLADLVPDLPAAVAELTASMLARDPAARPNRADGIVTTFRQARDELLDAPPPAVPARPAVPTTAARPSEENRPPKLQQERRERLAAARARQAAPWWLVLPLWIAIWIVLFLGARMGTVYFLKEFGNR